MRERRISRWTFTSGEPVKLAHQTVRQREPTMRLGHLTQHLDNDEHEAREVHNEKASDVLLHIVEELTSKGVVVVGTAFPVEREVRQVKAGM